MENTTKGSKRTDIHRVGAIIPAHYAYVLSYSLATTHGGWPVPSIGVNCALDRRVTDESGKVIKEGKHDPNGRCCVVGLLNVAKVPFADHGGTGKCTVCGAHFVYGDVWVHVPTGTHVHVGHDCVDKYNWVADRTDWESKDAAIRSGIAKLILKKEKEELYNAYLDARPGLREAIAVDHPVIKDIASKLERYGSLSNRQVEYVIALAKKQNAPKRQEEAHVNAPLGRQTFRGKVVSQKYVESNFGTQVKITVKVVTPDGSWLAWGTAPKSVLDKQTQVIGLEVEITATLTTGREPHFAFMGRPNGRIVEAEQAA